MKGVAAPTDRLLPCLAGMDDKGYSEEDIVLTPQSLKNTDDVNKSASNKKENFKARATTKEHTQHCSVHKRSGMQGGRRR